MNWTTQNRSTGIIVQVDTLTGRVIFSGTDKYRLLEEIIGGEWSGPLERPL